MLKVERCKKDKDISIRLKNPERKFDRYFIIAFGFALFIHLSAAFIFHIHLFTFGMIENILPPTIATAPLIKSSADEKDAIVTSKINTEGRLTAAHLTPPLSTPAIMDYENLVMTKPKSTAPFFLANLYTASDSETNEVKKQSIKIAPMLIQVSGPLADYKWEQLQLVEKEIAVARLKQSQLIYEVKTDEGQIFWYNLNTETANQGHLRLAEKLLKELQFQAKGMQNGWIEFIFSEEEA